jgi:folate-dependent phosphoribosylglycinamide formyltransferase PurN
MPDIPRLVIISAGDGGTTAEAFIHACQAGYIDAIVTDIIYNNPPKRSDPQNHIVPRVERINRQYKDYGKYPGHVIKLHKITVKTHPGGPGDKGTITEEMSEAMHQVMTEAGATLGMLLGFRKKIRGAMQLHWADKGLLTNNHPGRVDVAELRGLWGHAVHEKAYELAKEGKIDCTGLTVQLVNPEYDLGKPLDTVPVPISPHDTVDDIADNVRTAEKVYTPGIIAAYLQRIRA